MKTRSALQKIQREGAYKKAEKAVNIGAAGPSLKVDKNIVEGVQDTSKKIDASKKMVEDIIGKYFTGYEKLQHGSSSGHYAEGHDPSKSILDEGALAQSTKQSPLLGPSDDMYAPPTSFHPPPLPSHMFATRTQTTGGVPTPPFPALPAARAALALLRGQAVVRSPSPVCTMRRKKHRHTPYQPPPRIHLAS